jgi:hypothetical protein
MIPRSWMRPWRCCAQNAKGGWLHRLQREFGATNLRVNDESGYFDTGDLEALLKMRGIIADAPQRSRADHAPDPLGQRGR